MSWVRDLLVRVRGDKSHLDSTLKGAGTSVNSFGNLVSKLGGILAAAFSVRAIINWTKEAMKLAAEAEGVKNAFMKIGDARVVLESMKKATRGVIEESDLMALAVKAQNFNIPLKDLSKYLEFATNRAISTGKSVADLTELIVTGLGRKSSRSFIQLGLAAKDVQAAMKESGGMMRLVTSELEKMGPVADSATIAYGRLAANIKNFKEAYGEWVNQSKIVERTTSSLSDMFTMLADKNLTWVQKLGAFNGFLRASYIDHKKAREEEQAGIVVKEDAIVTKTKEIETIATLNEKLKEYKTDLEGANISDLKYINNLVDKIKYTEEYIKLLQSGALVPGSVKAPGKIDTGGLGGGNLLEGLTHPGLQKGPVMPEVKELSEAQQAWINSWKQATDEVTSMISDAFIGVFENIGKGSFKGFGDALLQNFGRFIANFGKMLVAMGTSMLLALTLMKAPSIPTAIAAIAAGGVAMAIGGLMMGMASKQSGNMGGSSGSGTSAAGMQKIKVEVYGKIAGKDIVISSRRYVEDN